MGTKATRKDFYMEIRKSPGRFLSILFIVALGVAFFSGIRSSEPSMRITGDAYLDDSSLMDIKAVSTMGITEDDIAAIEEVEGVWRAEGAYSADFLTNTDEEQYALHVMSLGDEMNMAEVTEGRLPEKVGECLADDRMGYEVGDKIVLLSGTDDPVSDTLKTEELTVVGTGSSACYISLNRGSTTIGTGSINGFLVVPENTFDLDVYTEVYVQVEGAADLTAFTDAYDEKIEAVIDRIEGITDERSEARRQDIIDEANEELEDARTELAEGKAEAEAELADAAQKIADGESQIQEARAEIEDGKKKIADAKSTLNSKQKELDSAKSEYYSGMQQLRNGKAAYEQGLAEFEAGRPEAEAKIQEGEAALAQGREQLDQGWASYYELLDAIKSLEAILEGAGNQPNPEPVEPEQPGEPDPVAPDQSNQEQLETVRAGQNRTGEQTGQPGQSADLQAQLEVLKSQAAAAKQELDAAEQEYSEQNAALEAARQQFQSAKQQLTGTKVMLDANESVLQQAYEQIQSGQSQIDSGWKELKSQETTLLSGEQELEAKTQELEDAKADYEEGKKEAEEEIADGEQKIADAEAELEDLDLPKWYVYDRSTLPELNGYGENADRMRAIGQVFPVIFFLVAALISLTSMTRMVEEQRIEIGTMKALGYSKRAIAGKYLGYALLATVGGSVIGVLIGEKLLPYIIIYAYGIIYPHVTHILVPYNWTYAAIASGAAIACTTVATFGACYRELGAQPAVLMRPPAPKKGKRVFLERIGIIWKHLNFSWKSTIRNLMRYKKRFFMTIFGIGGCMALMIVGFGLRDSIFEIADIQYKELQIYDGSIYLQEDLTEEDKNDLQAFLEKDKDVDRFMDAYMKNVTLTNGKKERATYECVLGTPEEAEQYVHFRDRKTKETYELSDHGVIISEKTAKLLDAKIGDTIYIKDEETGNKEVKIENICENYMGHYIYFTPVYYEEVFGEEPEYNSIFFAVDDSYSKKELEDVGKEILAEDEVLSVSYMHDIEKQLNDMLKSLNLVIVVLIISAGMLAFVVLYNLNNINITERQRELATLKVLGFYDPEVAAYVYRENILLTFIGAAVGVVFGKFLHLFVIRTVEVDAAMFGRTINLPSYIYSLLFTLAFSMIVNGVMFFKLRKIDMVESLKSIE